MEKTDFIYCKGTSVHRRGLRLLLCPELRQDTPYLLPEISQPVLVFAGTENQVVKGLGKTLVPLAEAGAIELEVLEGADHDFRDLYAEDLVDRAIEFIND